MKEKTSGLQDEVPIPFKDLLPQATFPNKNLSKQDLEELQSFSFPLVHLGMARAGFSADKAAEGGNPCPSPWTGPAEPSRDESTPVGTAQLQRCTWGLPALLLSHATDGDGGACLTQGLSCNGKAPDPFLCLIPLEQDGLNRTGLQPGWKSRIGISQGEISIEDFKREEDWS